MKRNKIKLILSQEIRILSNFCVSHLATRSMSLTITIYMPF